MVSIGMLNLIVAIAAIAILAAVMRYAYLVAGREPEDGAMQQPPTEAYDLERAA